MSGAAHQMLDAIKLHRLRRADEPAVRQLIEAALMEHWGKVEAAAHPDLAQLFDHYAQSIFLVAEAGDRIIGCGALVAEADGGGRIVRMVVAPEWRRHGLGGRLLHSLLDAARALGYQTVQQETPAHWQDAVRFYQSHGFTLVKEQAGSAHFSLALAA